MSEIRTLTLGDVLTADELAAQPFSATTVLTDRQTDPTLRDAFERMGNDEKRTYVLTAAYRAAAERWDLQPLLLLLLKLGYEAPYPGLYGRKR